MKYCMMTYTVSRQPDFFDISKMLDLTVELGMDGVDFVTLHGEKPQTLKKMCDDRGLKIVCHTFSADFNYTTATERKPAAELFKQGLENAVLLGATVIMMPTPVKQDHTSAQSRRNWIEGLNEVAPLAKAAGVMMTVENFPGKLSPFVTAAHFLEAAAEVPDLMLTFDAGNAATGENPVDSFQQTAKYAVHSHFKDWDFSSSPKEGFREMLNGSYYSPALIGEGCVQHASVLSAMEKAGYNGYINIEYEGNKYNPYEGIRRAVNYLRNIGI